MICAPVLIPTVCRYTHFRQCLESLSMCKWADKTDVFVAVDYPAKEEHWDGYNKIRQFLEVCGNFGFRSLNVIYRDHNYFYSSYSNATALIDQVLERFDRYIFTEDDNVFAPCFLEYINKGLEMFEKDNNILAIIGYRHFYPVRFIDNNFYRQNVDFSAWGYGMWKDRHDKYLKAISSEYYRSRLSWNSFWKVKQNGNNRLIGFLNSCNNRNIKCYDNEISILMALEDLDVIMPRESCVRNMGWDFSGEHCKTSDSSLADKHLKQSLCKDYDFDYQGSGKEFYKENKRIYVKSSYGRCGNIKLLLAILKNIIKYFLK